MDKYHTSLLKVAYEELKETKPEEIILEGHIIGLGSSDNPKKRASERSVILKWENRPDTNRSAKVICELSPKDYQKANQAHLDWQQVRMTGNVSKHGSIFKASNIRHFDLI